MKGTSKMSVKVEKTENKNEVKLTFEVEAEAFNNAITKVYFKSVKHFNIPGFRKGKAPQNVVERYYGVEIFYEDAFNEMVPEIYENALKENNIDAVSRPEIDITQIEKGKNVVFTATVQTKPEVKLGKYKGIEIPKVSYSVKDEDIEHELGHIAEKNGRLVSIEDRAVQDGDTAIIDFEGFVDDKPFDGGKAEKHELVIGSHTFIEGFEDQVKGMKIGEEKDVNVTFPEEYFSKELAAKPAVFKVKLHEIKVKELPAIDDELAKDASEFDTLEELKNSIKEKLEKENQNREKFETEEAAIKGATEVAEIEIPSGMIETEIDNMIKDTETRLSYQGMNFETYLKMINKTEEDFRKEYEQQATTNIKTRLTLEQVFIDAKLEIKEEDTNKEIEELSKTYGRKAEELKENENFVKYVEDKLKADAAVKYIIDNAKNK